jgi:hypothetical protein
MSARVTVTVRRRVRPGREADDGPGLSRLVEGVRTGFSGDLGAEFHRPGPDGAYRSAFRFDSLGHREAVEQSKPDGRSASGGQKRPSLRPIRGRPAQALSGDSRRAARRS